MESAQREAQVLEIKRQGQLKALEAQRAKKEVMFIKLPPPPLHPTIPLLPWHGQPFFHLLSPFITYIDSGMFCQSCFCRR